MEFVGDEKRIQALFSELSLETQSRTPHFNKLWNRAEANAFVPAPLALRFATVIVGVVVIAVLGLLATRLWFSSSQYQQVANIPPQIIPTTLESRLRPPQQLRPADTRNVSIVRPRRLVRHQTERAAIQQAAMLSNWQSPTNILLNSPTLSVLSTLPQLNQSARDLEQFLPKNNKVIKESNQ